MDIKVINYHYYMAMYSDNTNKIALIGSQIIYSLDLQDILIKTFYKDNFIKVYFEINDVILNPCYICPLLPKNYIVVSDDFFMNYYINKELFNFNIVYDIPKVQKIILQRKAGNFPNESLDDLLSYYLENNFVINKHQVFNVDFINDYITFEIKDIQYVNELNFSITDRLNEMNYTIDFNQYYFDKTFTYNECIINVHNYNWLIKSKQDNEIQYGDVSFQEVNIEFMDSEINSLNEITQPIVKKVGSTSKLTTEIVPDFNQIQNELQESSIISEKISKEEMRLKRLAFFDK
jgi:hypothetical protein